MSTYVHRVRLGRPLAEKKHVIGYTYVDWSSQIHSLKKMNDQHVQARHIARCRNFVRVEATSRRWHNENGVFRARACFSMLIFQVDMHIYRV
jgi:hypothetical protein